MSERSWRPAAAIAGGALVLLCCGGPLLLWDATDELRNGPREAPIRGVRTMTVAPGGGLLTRSFTGTARAGEEARLSFKVAGTVKAVHVKVGDKVEAGTRIAELDALDLGLRVQQADAALAQAEALHRNARSNYDRIRELYIADNASQADMEAARAAADSAAAAVSAARQQRALTAQQLGYATLEAGSAGAIVDVRVNAGENVAAGQPIASIASGSRIEVVVGIPASLIARVEEGAQVTATFPSATEQIFDATVTEIGVSTSAASTYPVTVRLDEETPEVRPGMTASILWMFPPTETRQHPRVPASAVARDGEGRFVWVVEPEPGRAHGRTVRRYVTLGEEAADGIDVVDGLANEDIVVTAGVSRLRERQRVRLPVE